MLPRTRKLGLAWFPAALVAIPLVTASPAGGGEEVAGVLSMAYVNQQKLAIPDAAGHVLLLTEARGTNRNTGSSDFMSGAQVAVHEILDLVQGNGASQGYVTFSKGPDTVFVRISGKVTTRSSPEGSPITSFVGTWNYTKGTGRYVGIEGTGTYRGRFTSEREFTVDWQGEYTQ